MPEDFSKKLLQERIEKDERSIKELIAVGAIVTTLLFLDVIYLNFVVFKFSAKTATKIESSNSITSESTKTPSPTPTIVPEQSQGKIEVSQAPSVKDYYVSFGAGSSVATDWTDVPGVESTIDFGNYQNIKEVRFEASINVPTANEQVWVRLFNINDKHEVWNSEVSMSNDTSYLTSDPVSYDSGPKRYQVQMKTQLGFTANLSQSRVHIVLK